MRVSVRARTFPDVATDEGFTAVDALPGVGDFSEGSPFRAAATRVIARYAPLSVGEAIAVRASRPPPGTVLPHEAVLTDVHLYVSVGRGTDATALRVPRSSLSSRWRMGPIAGYRLGDGSSVVLAARDGDAFLAHLDDELDERTGTPHTYARSGALGLLTTSIATGLAMQFVEFGAVIPFVAVAGTGFFVRWLRLERVWICADGLTLGTGRIGTRSRFVPRAEVWGVVVRAQDAPHRMATVEVELRDARNVPTYVVVARSTWGSGSAKARAREELLPMAQRLATLLDVRGPSWA